MASVVHEGGKKASLPRDGPRCLQLPMRVRLRARSTRRARLRDALGDPHLRRLERDHEGDSGIARWVFSGKQAGVAPAGRLRHRLNARRPSRGLPLGASWRASSTKSSSERGWRASRRSRPGAPGRHEFA